MLNSMLPFQNVKREILVKKESETSDKFGKHPEERSVEERINYGIVNIDKPSGPTSHQVSAYVQKILNLNKSGHSGTLDPKVTGVLPVAIGSATRVVQSLLTAGKEYVALMHLHHDADEHSIRNVFQEFTGRIKQLPPIRSSVKRRLRERSIYYINIIEINEKDVLFKVGCEAGTYIRKLIHDIGERLKIGAHMAELRRTRVGPFDEETLISLQDLTDAYYYYKEENNDAYLKKAIIPVEYAISHLGKIWVFDTTVDSLCHGASLKIPGISKFDSGINEEDNVAVLTLKNELIMIGKAKTNSENILKSEKGIVITPEQVFMKPGVYPRIEKKV